MRHARTFAGQTRNSTWSASAPISLAAIFIYAGQAIRRCSPVWCGTRRRGGKTINGSEEVARRRLFPRRCSCIVSDSRPDRLYCRSGRLRDSSRNNHNTAASDWSQNCRCCFHPRRQSRNRAIGEECREATSVDDAAWDDCSRGVGITATTPKRGLGILRAGRMGCQLPVLSIGTSEQYSAPCTPNGHRCRPRSRRFQVDRMRYSLHSERTR